MSYDGSDRWAAVERLLTRDGFVRSFSCATFDTVPAAVGWTGRETGWELRRKLKAYCQGAGIKHFRIVRNSSYHRDLHGIVYELWTYREPAAEDLAA